jgi:hypothetical protein
MSWWSGSLLFGFRAIPAWVMTKWVELEISNDEWLTSYSMNEKYLKSEWRAGEWLLTLPC